MTFFSRLSQIFGYSGTIFNRSLDSLIVICAELHSPFVSLVIKKFAYPPGPQFQLRIFARILIDFFCLFRSYASEGIRTYVNFNRFRPNFAFLAPVSSSKTPVPNFQNISTFSHYISSAISVKFYSPNFPA